MGFNKDEEREIITLSGGEHVRSRSSMYLDGDPETALRLALREVWVNGCDEITFRGKKGKIFIQIDSQNKTLTVSDNGGGIPSDKVVDAYLKVNTGSNFKNRTASLAGANGVGLKAVSHTAEWVKVVSRHRDEETNMEIIWGDLEGELKAPIKVNKIPSSEKSSGVTTTFKPSEQIYGDSWIDEAVLIAEIDEAAKFYPDITFVIEGDFGKKTINYPKGLNLKETEAYYESGNLIISLSLASGQIKPFGNRLYLKDGGAFYTHFKTQLTRAINDTIDFKINGSEIQAALSGYVAVYVENPIFSNQQKSAIGNKEMNPEITVAVKELVEQLKRSSGWKKFIAALETEMKAEAAAERAREKVLKAKKEFKAKAVVDASKLTECSSKDRKSCELFITEGLSASGTVKNARQSASTQAIFSLRGKILNVNKTTYEKVLENKELMMLVKALGGTLGENGIQEPSPRNRRYGRIIFLNDHDEDGYAIEALLLGFFYKYFPGMIEDGCLYRISPALFMLEKGEKREFFPTQREALAAQKTLPGKWTLSRSKGWGAMDAPAFAQVATDLKTRKLIQIQMGNAASAARAIELLEIDVTARKELVKGDFFYEAAMEER